MDQNNELYHFGVLGMKWGRRKSRSKSSGVKKSSSKKKTSKTKSAKKILTDSRKQTLKNIGKSSAAILGATVTGAIALGLGIDSLIDYKDAHFIGPRYGNKYSVGSSYSYDRYTPPYLIKGKIGL